MKLATLSCLFLLSSLAQLSKGDHDFHTCDWNEYDLLDGSTKVGFIQVFDDIFKSLQIKVAITEDAPAFTLITRVYGTACCPDGSGCLEFQQAVSPATDFTLPSVQEPMCGEGKVVDVTVHADLQTGGTAAYNAMFDPPPTVEFWVTTGDSGTDPSYFDAKITNSEHPQLTGKRLDAYCIDVQNTIKTGPNNDYEGKLYSWLDVMENPQRIPNVKHPDRLDSVAYCINNYSAGSTRWNDNSVLTSGTLQRAIWEILGDGQSTAGLGSFNQQWAMEIAADCLAQGEGFAPGCGDNVPIVVVPEKRAQNLYVQTQFASLGLMECSPSTATADAEALCEPNSRTKHPGGFGDPHFLSWTGEFFDFQGACDVVLAQSQTFGHGLGFAVHLRLAQRYDYSFIESAAVQIGDDVLQVSGYGDYLLNGVANAKLPYSMGGLYTLTRAYKDQDEKDVAFNIEVDGLPTITLAAHKDLVSVRFHPEAEQHFFDAQGLMGDFHQGRHLSRDGKIVFVDNNAFGKEWQVRPGVDPELFVVPQEPGARCVLPQSTGNIQQSIRRLGETNVTQEAATEACRLQGYTEGPAMEACIYDVVATQDLDAAEAGVY